MNNNLKTLIGVVIVAIIAIVAAAIGINSNVSIKADDNGFNADIQLSEDQVPAVIEDDKGEYIEVNIPTVEEVDGGLFEDEVTGVSITEGEYADLGWSEWYPTDTPEAFKNATLGRCIIAGNYWGAQCVSLSRVYWWSYADRDVSTCGTGMAKGMMNCAEQNAGDDFEIYWKDSALQIQSGDWLIFDGGQYGHVGMALGPVINGYVALLGENQGGRACQGGGAATNVINISIKNLIGYYRPKSYIKPEPTPEPEPTPDPIVDKCERWEVKKGDTLGKIMYTCRGEIEWGAAMDDYAGHWYSLKFKKYLTVFDGWNSVNGVGLFAGDTIEYRTER